MEKHVTNNSTVIPQPDSTQGDTPPAPKAQVAELTAVPISNAEQPNKTVPAPKFVVCMASDAKLAKGLVHALESKKTDE